MLWMLKLFLFYDSPVDLPVDIHNDIFLAASMIGEAMQSMVTEMSRNAGKQRLPILPTGIAYLKW